MRVVSAERLRAGLRPRAALLPGILGMTLLWWLPAAFVVGLGDLASGCTPLGCLGTFWDDLWPGALVYLALTYPLGALTTVVLERLEVPRRAPWLFDPPTRVWQTVAGLASLGIVLLGLAAGRALFTEVGRWLLYTLWVPLFDAVVLLGLLSDPGGPTSIWPAVAVGLPVVGFQVCWWYGLGYASVRVVRRLGRLP
jgi:hypothetical protein